MHGEPQHSTTWSLWTSEATPTPHWPRYVRYGRACQSAQPSSSIGPWLQLMVTAQERIFRGAVTGRCNSKNCTFAPGVSNGVYKELGICWTGYQAWLTRGLTREPRFSDWYAWPRYASWYARKSWCAATWYAIRCAGKAAFTGAENLSKPDIAVWFNQAFIEQYARA